jgi:hypothetical protein
MLRGSHSTSRSIASTRGVGDVVGVALRPAADLAGEIVARLAEVAEADGLRVDAVEPGERVAHGVEMGPARVAGDIGEGAVPDDPALDAVHHVEPGADDGLVGAQAPRPRNREAGGMERGDDPVFAVDRVGGFEQLPGRFAAEHIGPAGGHQLVGGIRLAAPELADLERAFEPLDIGFHPGGEGSLVEPVGLAHGVGPLELPLPACHVGHASSLPAARASSLQPISRRNSASAKLMFAIAA